jgi:cell division protein FtsQ
MARKASPTILQEELYPPSAAVAREELDDARLLDLDVDEESPFLRGQKRVSARRSSLPRKTANRLLWTILAAVGLCVLGALAAALYHYGERSWRFRVDSSDDIEVTGMQNVTKAQIMEVMGADIGRNIFFIPLAQQKAQLEQIPWVESASVMRFVPNTLKVEIQERTPVAFARVGPRISLIDAGGTLMELPLKHKYSFPVILGMNPGEPLSTRAPRMKAYNQLVRDLDSSGAGYSQDLSEIDLSDLDDVKVRVNDPAGDVLVHLGSSNYLTRYKVYVTHVQAWRQQFQKLESVDLRYDNQIIVNPDMQGTVKQASLSPAAARAAAAAGVRPAALLTRLVTRTAPHDRSVPRPAFEMTESKLNSKVASGQVRKSIAKTQVKLKAVKARKTARKAAVPKKAASHGKPATSTAGKNNGSGPPRSMAAQKPSVGQRVAPIGLTAPVPAASNVPKPSPAIAKQQGNQSPD